MDYPLFLEDILLGASCDQTRDSGENVGFILVLIEKSDPRGRWSISGEALENIHPSVRLEWLLGAARSSSPAACGLLVDLGEIGLKVSRV